MSISHQCSRKRLKSMMQDFNWPSKIQSVFLLLLKQPMPCGMAVLPGLLAAVDAFKQTSPLFEAVLHLDEFFCVNS